MSVEAERRANNQLEAYVQIWHSHHDCTLNNLNDTDVAFVDFLGVEQFDWTSNIRLVNFVNKLKHEETRSSPKLYYKFKEEQEVETIHIFSGFILFVLDFLNIGR